MKHFSLISACFAYSPSLKLPNVSIISPATIAITIIGISKLLELSNIYLPNEY